MGFLMLGAFIVDVGEQPSPAASPAPSGIPSSNGNASITQTYSAVPATNSTTTPPATISPTVTNNQSGAPHPPSTSTGSFQYETYQTFDWELYLKETNSSAVPTECFKQVCLFCFFYSRIDENLNLIKYKKRRNG